VALDGHGKSQADKYKAAPGLRIQVLAGAGPSGAWSDVVPPSPGSARSQQPLLDAFDVHDEVRRTHLLLTAGGPRA